MTNSPVSVRRLAAIVTVVLLLSAGTAFVSTTAGLSAPGQHPEEDPGSMQSLDIRTTQSGQTTTAKTENTTDGTSDGFDPKKPDPKLSSSVASLVDEATTDDTDSSQTQQVTGTQTTVTHLS